MFSEGPYIIVFGNISSGVSAGILISKKVTQPGWVSPLLSEKEDCSINHTTGQLLVIHKVIRVKLKTMYVKYSVYIAWHVDSAQ